MLTPMVVPELTLLEVQVESRRLEPPELVKPGLGEISKVIDPVVSTTNPQAFGIAGVHEPVIAHQVIRGGEGLKILNLPVEGESLLTESADSFSDPQEVAIHRVPIETGFLGDLEGGKVLTGKEAYNLPKLGLRYF